MKLTQRENEIMMLAIEGFKPNQIAKKTFSFTPDNKKPFTRNLCQKQHP